MKQTSRSLIILSFLYSTCILALGSWWLYLIVRYGEKVAQITGDETGERVLKMVKWEGGTFLTMLILLSASLLFLYLKDQRKTKGLQAFYAGMTHEMKTPLASMKLQAEVLEQEIKSLGNERAQTLIGRLLDDAEKMETQMDKILQLSRLEGGGTFHLQPLNLSELWQRAASTYGKGLEISGDIPSELMILGDELALSLIFRNLFENTKNHSQSQKINISIEKDNSNISLKYNDYGKFQGDITKLGTLFYKHNSKKGSGIGLYLVKKLMETMKGMANLEVEPNLIITLQFLRKQGAAHVS